MSLIQSQSEFEALCSRIHTAGAVAFDTEFIAESYFRPRLCLLQFATAEEEVCVDPFPLTDVSPWWDIMTDDSTTIVVHGGREEIRFCQFATGKRPGKLIDVQVVEGLLSRGYPLSHANLVSRVLGKTLHGKETRTDWERRPLAEQQVEYAVEDVRFLLAVWARQSAALRELGRYEWALDEVESFIDVVMAEEVREGWLKLPNYGRLNRRQMLLAKRLFLWRMQEAERQNKPQRRLFRDDLLVEVAKRQPTSVKDLNLTRGMNRRDYQQYADEMIRIASEVAEIPNTELPEKPQSPQYPSQDEVLSRILGLALANRCQQLGMSMSLVATTADLKELVRWHVFDNQTGELPALMRGWRGEVCGRLLQSVLDGNVTLRVVDPRSENPLQFDQVD